MYIQLECMVVVEKQVEEFPPCNDMLGKIVKLQNLHYFEVKIQHLSVSTEA